MIAALKAHAGWLVHALGLARNPLRRPIDRVAAAISVLLLLVALAAVPAAAVFGKTLHERLAERAAVAAATSHPVTAVLLTPPSLSTPASEGYNQDSLTSTASVQWQTGSGPRTETMQVPAGSSRGDTLTIWADQHGDRVPPPPTQSSVTASAIFAALLVLLIAELACFGLIGGTQHLARLLALRGWEREWAFLQRGGTWSQR
ncbi:Rv1733c family protein [Saccharopolyspora rosea]|uniref:Transmembrane protein n=1 Tax=Saccharopolyspora rosea TaxID=524884 RepID=A0ABW3FWQ0_9PSEU|nr:hypothetical protein [Saccharopolyspora rosea]